MYVCVHSTWVSSCEGMDCAWRTQHRVLVKTMRKHWPLFNHHHHHHHPLAASFYFPTFLCIFQNNRLRSESTVNLLTNSEWKSSGFVSKSRVLCEFGYKVKQKWTHSVNCDRPEGRTQMPQETALFGLWLSEAGCWKIRGAFGKCRPPIV